MMPVVTNDQAGTPASSGSASVAAPGATPAPVPVALFDATGTIRIGRDPDNDIVLPDFWVSRKHAEIRRIGTEHHLVDLASSNGTAPQRPSGAQGACWRPATGSPSAGTSSSSTGRNCYQHDDQGPTSIIADDITVEIAQGGPARRRQLRAAPRHPARHRRAERLRQVHAAQGDDRVPPGDAGPAALRRQGPLRALLRAALPHRHGAAGRRAAPPAHGAPGPALRRVPAVRQRRAAQAAHRAGQRGAGTARPDRPGQAAHRHPLRRPAQAHLGRPGAADRAVAARPGRADLRPGPGAGQGGHARAAAARRPRPYGRRGHPQRAAPRPVRLRAW